MGIKSIRHLPAAPVDLLFGQRATLPVTHLLTSAYLPGFAPGLPESAALGKGERSRLEASQMNSSRRFSKSKGNIRALFPKQLQPQALGVGAMAARTHLSAQPPSDPQAGQTHLFPVRGQIKLRKDQASFDPDSCGTWRLPPPQLPATPAQPAFILLTGWAFWDAISPG